ncbi:MAG: lysophospholipid acyltransferase family protein [Idiomarina sp.]
MDKIPEHLYGELPRRGNAFTRWFGRLGLRVLGGWKINGELPELRQAIIPVAPHTSNWDFFVGVFVMFALGLRLNFLGKHTIFRFPVNGILRRLGGIPIDRSAAQGVVGQMVEQFRSRNQLVLALAPEGTRKKVTEWKRGFLHIAHQTQVPVIPVCFDFSKRSVDIAKPMMIASDIEAELVRVKAAVAHAIGRNPEHA